MLKLSEILGNAFMTKIKSEAFVLHNIEEVNRIVTELVKEFSEEKQNEIQNSIIREIDLITELNENTKIETSIDNKKTVVVCWSGGLDSTALIGNLLVNDYDVLPVYLIWRKGQYLMREFAAIYNIYKKYETLPKTHFRGRFYAPLVIDMEPLGEIFKISENLIPNRNELFVNIVSNVIMKPLKINKLGTGEYDGADKWVVTWDVPVNDCEPGSFKKWLKFYYGEDAEFLYLGTFGKSYFKHNRLYQGLTTFGRDIMELTTCCLSDTLIDCGVCYTCVERYVAFELNGIKDPTWYMYNPKNSFLYELYKKQMKGESLK